jgi:hypothetical protein
MSGPCPSTSGSEAGAAGHGHGHDGRGWLAATDFFSIRLAAKRAESISIGNSIASQADTFYRR